MISVDTKGGAIALLVVALILLGTWGPLLNLAERRGRHTVHTYMDFSIGFVLVAVVCALTFGQVGDTIHGENFFDQMRNSHEKAPLIGFAMASGFCIFFGNLAEQYALALAGVTIAVPMFSSCIVVLGTVLNYVLDKGLNKATILFPGVACFALAVVAGALTHVFNEEHLNKRKRRFDDSVHRHAVGNATIGFEHGAGDRALPGRDDSAHKANALGPRKAKDEEAGYEPEAGKAARVNMADAESPYRSVRTDSRQRVIYGISIAIVGGLIGALFSPGFNVTTNDNFGTLAPGVKPFTVYTGYFWFCTIYFVLAIIVTHFMMRYPPLGQQRSTWIAWVKDHNWLSAIGFLSGILVSIANVLQFLGGQAAGYAASDLVQANPLVATFWGILFFKEYRNSSLKAYISLGCMYCFFIAAVALLAASAQERSGQ
ncbi:fatty acid elongase 3-ketoacyl-CoA synthase 1 [Coccomyxa subellipsoidea C-169]|uniref:Fatty acid elongase 3-ketoacyl-CoA synthase 1 n=1 Tax=Coccomyxa subellipsoidea (strain C-169) TaxID=574566 RepID=I0YS91_COCSC|nr:fatty acid elongase 3-ketoacyl-CoA synthase 1 [Coccomyxa subellipsoidea C-169]EIE21260.1 fatty acid elongase 3-ketoacyl-CoA synthase 1 [Coccomyxa subellipsoidea C-169]|eukprot:XP_005645804.1 fatty acid elongase 3-ketoacyl-CoA synthase 1 [Coccomyxa subellipsoidea C-169]